MADVFCLALFAGMMVPSVWAATTMVDLTGPGCDQIDGYYIQNKDDYISLYAYPQYNTIATRDHCDVTVRADQGRRIEYIIENIFFNECGVEIRMYDNPTIDTNPIQVITCSYNSKIPIQGKTNFNVLRVRVRKTTPESRAFTFTMRVKNDLGPSMEFEADAARYTGEELEPGAIAGLAIAGGIIVIALILLGVFLVVRARKSTLTDNYATDGPPSKHTSGKTGRPTSEPEKQYLPPVISISEKEYMHQMRSSARPPQRPRPPVPMPTQPAPRDPERRGLSDRHRSGEHATKPASKTRHMDRRTRESNA